MRLGVYVIDLNRGLHLKDNKGNYTGTLVYEKTTFGRYIYKSPLSDEDICNRIENYYLPYYVQLENMIIEKLKVFERVYFMDLHSFYYQSDVDICLGTVDGKTASDSTLLWIKNNLMQEGFSVDQNNIFRGGHCVRHLREKFSNRLDCVALELRYTAYLDNRYFGEEEVENWNKELFSCTQGKLKNAFNRILKQWHSD